MARNTRIFSDLDLNFTPHPVTKDIVRKFDEQAVKQSIKNLIMTANYERPFHSEIGSPIRKLLFENPSPLVIHTLRQTLRDLIANFEPRVEVLEIFPKFNLDGNELFVRITFRIVNTTTPLNVEVVLDRTR